MNMRECNSKSHEQHHAKGSGVVDAATRWLVALWRAMSNFEKLSSLKIDREHDTVVSHITT